MLASAVSNCATNRAIGLRRSVRKLAVGDEGIPQFDCLPFELRSDQIDRGRFIDDDQRISNRNSR